MTVRPVLATLRKTRTTTAAARESRPAWKRLGEIHLGVGPRSQCHARTARRLIQEQDGRVSAELDPDRKPLALAWIT